MISSWIKIVIVADGGKGERGLTHHIQPRWRTWADDDAVAHADDAGAVDRCPRADEVLCSIPMERSLPDIVYIAEPAAALQRTAMAVRCRWCHCWRYLPDHCRCRHYSWIHC